VIDLHTHTTASDGLCTPSELVARAGLAGVHVLGVTDHDTVAGLAEAAVACASSGIEFVPGIEITTAVGHVDVHILGYFLDLRSSALVSFLSEQRRRRIDRVRRIIGRLRTFGLVLDADTVVQPAIADPSRAAGRPWIARALVAAGHVQTTAEAFDRWLGRGRPAFVPRDVASPADVFARIHEAGGLASLAHPWLLDLDREIATFANAGLDAIEAYGADPDRPATTRYVSIADDLGLAVSGISDYHADTSHGAAALGSASLPQEAFDVLKSRRRGD
jgi:3',5'-nucleoside bisphosphate phosphatase